jgi:NADPH2:quinone reductase
MRAAFYEKAGAARDVLRVDELPTPTPGPGEVRVRIAWSGVNPSDVKSRAMASGRPIAFPRIVPHSDGAGTIDAVGAGVPESRVGERVWVWNGQWQRPFGTAAEYVTLPAHQAVPLPDGIDLAVGACLGIPALTAYHAAVTDGGVAGKRVLVAGGAGAVGHYAVQLARRLGARQILATVSGPEKGEVARAAGADVVVNYRTEDAAARIREVTGGAGVDRIIEVDAAANIGLDVQVVAPEGDLVIYGTGKPEIPMPFGPLIMKNVGVRFFIVYNLPLDVQRRAIAHLTAMLERGDLTHNVAARLPLERIAEAHELVEQGRVIGNVLVSPDGSGNDERLSTG